VFGAAVYAASVFFLLQSMSALGFIDGVIYGGQNFYGRTGDKVSETLNLLSIFASLFLFFSSNPGIRIAHFNRILPLAAASFILISVLWSVDPRQTLTQGTAYFFVVLGAIGLAEALDGDQLMDLVAWICLLCAAASVVQFSISPGSDGFSGIFSQKNVLGQVMAGGVLAGLHGTRRRGGPRLRYVCIIASCTVVAFMSKSTTSILAIFVVFWLDLLGRLYLRGGTTRIISICLTIGCVPIVIFFVMNSDSIFELLGKETTLTGRTLFWPYVIDNISLKPLLGWGFCSFWSPRNPNALQIADAIKGDTWFPFLIPNAHNGLLEFLLEIGFVGTLFFMFLWVRNVVMALRCMNGSAAQIGLTSLLLLIGIFVISISEVVLLAASQIWTNLFFVMGFICEKNLWIARSAQRPRPSTYLAERMIRRRIHSPGL
jgi:O-antigen ligase